MTDETSSEASVSTRERLLDAARTLFGEKGYAGTSTREIAARAECNVALISHYFGSKEGLLRALLTEGISRLTNELSKIAAQETDPEKRLRRIVRFLVGYFAQNHASMRVMHRELLRTDSPVLGEVGPGAAAYHNVLADILEEARRAGRLRDLDPQLAALLLMGMLQIYFVAYPLASRVLGPASPELLEALENHVTDVFLHGVLARGSD